MLSMKDSTNNIFMSKALQLASFLNRGLGQLGSGLLYSSF